MGKSISKVLLFFSAGILAISGFAIPEKAGATEVKTATRDIQIVPVRQEKTFFKYVMTHKKVYRVGEPIKFSFVLKKPAYIYIVTISRKTGKAYLLLPNRYESYNYFKRTNYKYVVPTESKKYSFIPDTPGVEEVYIVASSKDLTKHNVNTRNYFKDRNLPFPTTDEKSARSFVRDIQVVPKKEKIEMVRISIPVRPAGTQQIQHVSASVPVRPDEGKTDTMLFLSTGKYSYRIGVVADILIKSNKKGFAYLFIEEPTGRKSLLSSLKIEKGENVVQRFKVTEPTGEHRLIAIYTEKEVKNPLHLLRLAFSSSFRSKGLAPLGTSQQKGSIVYNVHSIEIVQ